MNYLDVVEAVLARALDWHAEFPSTNRPMFRRVGIRQRQLFEKASNANPDYYGQCATCVLDAEDCCDLRDMVNVATVNEVAGVQRVEIADAGTSAFADGDKVHVISIDDPDAAIAPRASLRDFIFRGIAGDFTDVTSIRVFYSRIPDMPVSSEDGTTELELLPQHQELLVIDLAKDLVKKTKTMDADVKQGLIADLTTEESEAMTDYLADIGSFATTQERRFSEPPAQAGR